MSDILVIGIGSDLRGDDGVGLAVARRLQNQVPPGVRVIEHHGDGVSLISEWQGVDLVILVDAAAFGAEPGTIVRFKPPFAPLPARISASSTHAFGLEEALELSRQLDQLPKSLVVYGIEGKSFSFGTDLSMEVDLAVEAVVGQILQDISTDCVFQCLASPRIRSCSGGNLIAWPIYTNVWGLASGWSSCASGDQELGIRDRGSGIRDRWRSLVC